MTRIVDQTQSEIGSKGAHSTPVRGDDHARLHSPGLGSRFLRGAATSRILVLLAIAGAAALGVFYWLSHRGFESTEDAFVEGTLAYLAPEIQGRVVEVLVGENQRVKQGDVLVRLDREESEIQVARAEANLAAARNRMISAEAAAASADAEGKAATVESWRTGRELSARETLAIARGRRRSTARCGACGP